jgi:hypothetical protein
MQPIQHAKQQKAADAQENALRPLVTPLIAKRLRPLIQQRVLQGHNPCRLNKLQGLRSLLLRLQERRQLRMERLGRVSRLTLTLLRDHAPPRIFYLLNRLCFILW